MRRGLFSLLFLTLALPSTGSATKIDCPPRMDFSKAAIAALVRPNGATFASQTKPLPSVLSQISSRREFVEFTVAEGVFWGTKKSQDRIIVSIPVPYEGATFSSDDRYILVATGGSELRETMTKEKIPVYYVNSMCNQTILEKVNNDNTRDMRLISIGMSLQKQLDEMSKANSNPDTEHHSH